MKRAKKSKQSIGPAINRKFESVSQSSESSQRQLDIAARCDVFEAICQGIDDINRGRTRAAREVFLTMRRKYGIQR